MRSAIFAAAILLAACTSSEDNLANDVGAANAGQSTKTPIQGDEGSTGSASQPAGPDGAGNDQAPAPQPPPTDRAPEPEPSGSVILHAAPTQIAPGGNVSLTLANESRSRIGYNLCTSALLNAAGAEVRTGRVCTLELRTLEPGGKATYSYQLPNRLADGSYRFTTGVDRMGSGGPTSARSNSIEVR